MKRVGIKNRPGRATESVAEVNHLRFEVVRLTQAAGDLADLLEIERKRADMYEVQARRANAELGALRRP